MILWSDIITKKPTPLGAGYVDFLFYPLSQLSSKLLHQNYVNDTVNIAYVKLGLLEKEDYQQAYIRFQISASLSTILFWRLWRTLSVHSFSCRTWVVIANGLIPFFTKYSSFFLPKSRLPAWEFFARESNTKFPMRWTCCIRFASLGYQFSHSLFAFGFCGDTCSLKSLEYMHFWQAVPTAGGIESLFHQFIFILWTAECRYSKTRTI